LTGLNVGQVRILHEKRSGKHAHKWPGTAHPTAKHEVWCLPFKSQPLRFYGPQPAAAPGPLITPGMIYEEYSSPGGQPTEALTELLHRIDSHPGLLIEGMCTPDGGFGRANLRILYAARAGMLSLYHEDVETLARQAAGEALMTPSEAAKLGLSEPTASPARRHAAIALGHVATPEAVACLLENLTSTPDLQVWCVRACHNHTHRLNRLRTSRTLNRVQARRPL
jgi:hypothetical protein